MQFVSLSFLLLLPVAALINFIIPRKFRYIWLLVISAAFYISIDLKAAAVMAGTVVVTYLAALLIEKVSGGAEEKRTKGATALLVLAIVIEVAAMLIFRSGKIMGAIGISFALFIKTCSSVTSWSLKSSISKV